DALRREVDRGGQVFFLHNRVQTIETVAAELREAMPNVRFIIGHAQLSEHQLEHVMDAFMDHEYDVLISTTIIENGIDIPNANTIIIDRADTFGLAQLYQMRGRVGRSNRRAYAYLLIPKGITGEARHRLEALTQYDYLGAGFQVALRDLEIRGAGAILGIKQSGVIQNIGFNYYNHLLEKAIEAVQTNQPELFLQDEFPEARQAIKTEIDLYFPPDYIADDEEWLRIYRRLNELESLEEIAEFGKELSDRFGKIPAKADWLLLYFQLNLLSRKANLQNTHVRNGRLVLDFKSEALPPKERILSFCSQLEQAFKIDVSKGIKITIELDLHASYIEQFAKAIEILKGYVGS
ncbi:MAG: helicase-related protein, partial [Candidatus Cloacimonetes bacterium]|nr:helicase-related protein [Candidatus Cloacimonadota bacterium]